MISMEGTTHSWVYDDDEYGRNYPYMSVWCVWKRLLIHEYMISMEGTSHTWVNKEYGRNYSYMSLQYDEYGRDLPFMRTVYDEYGRN